MGKHETFRAHIIKELVEYAGKNNYFIKTNDGMSNLKSFVESDLNDGVLYWLCKNENPVAYLRFAKYAADGGCVVIDNKSISLMLDNELKRLTDIQTNGLITLWIELLKNRIQFQESLIIC